jgi:hypothetical protein
MIISTNAGRAFNKIQHPFLIKKIISIEVRWWCPSAIPAFRRQR